MTTLAVVPNDSAETPVLEGRGLDQVVLGQARQRAADAAISPPRCG